MRCDGCPVPAGLDCRGEVLRHKCGDPRYRAYFVNRATGSSIAVPPRETDAELLDNAESCPHRVPFPPEESPPCGCRWKCLAGKGPARRKGGVLLADCWACPIAPRLTQ